MKITTVALAIALSFGLHAVAWAAHPCIEGQECCDVSHENCAGPEPIGNLDELALKKKMISELKSFLEQIKTQVPGLGTFEIMLQDPGQGEHGVQQGKAEAVLEERQTPGPSESTITTSVKITLTLEPAGQFVILLNDSGDLVVEWGFGSLVYVAASDELLVRFSDGGTCTRDRDRNIQYEGTDGQKWQYQGESTQALPVQL